MTRIGILSALVIVLSQPGFSSAGDKGPELQRIADASDGHVHPAMCVTKKGTVLVAHFAETSGQIYLVRSTDGGRTWKDAGKVADIGGGKPYPGALTTLADGRILLTWNFWLDPKNYDKGRRPYFAVSDDEGHTWTAPRKLPVELSEPGYSRHAIWERSPREWIFGLGDRLVKFDPITDRAEPFPSPKVFAGPIVQTKKGTLLYAGHRSTDEGKTWTPIKDGPRMAHYTSGMLVLAKGWIVADNPRTKDSHALVVSYDDGVTWSMKTPYVVDGKGRVISHPGQMAQLDADNLGIVLWDADRKQPGGIGVYFARIPLEELRKWTSPK